MIREIRIYWALRVHVKELSREWEGINVKFSVNGVIQILGTLGQIANTVGGFLPAKQQVYVAATLAALQGLSAVLAHFSNPDGTPASVPYIPGK